MRLLSRSGRVLRNALTTALALFTLATPSPSPAGAPGDPPPYAAAFDAAFQPGFAVEQDGARLPFQVLELGELALPSGRLVACDLLADPDHEAFSAPLPHGRFPVRLAIVRSKQWGPRTAFARLDVRPGPVARWAMALTPQQDLAKLEPGQSFGYGVDAGTGAFLDAETLQALLKDKVAYETIVNAWIPEKREGVLFRNKEANVAVFHSGFGDGFYSTWIGYDASGAVLAVVTDFAVIDWAKAK